MHYPIIASDDSAYFVIPVCSPSMYLQGGNNYTCSLSIKTFDFSDKLYFTSLFLLPEHQTPHLLVPIFLMTYGYGMQPTILKKFDLQPI